MSDSNSPMAINKVIVETLIRGLEQAQRGISDLQSQVHANEITMVGVKTQLETMSSEVSELIKLLRNGNGSNSIQDRLKDVETKQEAMNSFIESHKAERQENVKGSWQLKIAVAAGSLSLLGTIGTIIVTLLK